MATNRRSARGHHRSDRTSHLGLEGLEPRAVLSGMPIDLQAVAGSVLNRLAGERLPPVVGADPIAAVAATGFAVTLPSTVPNGLPVRALITAVAADGRPVPFSGQVTLSSSDAAATFPETVTLSRGRAFVSVTFATAGEQTLEVDFGGETPLTGSGTTRVAEPIVATRLAILLAPSTRVDAPARVMIMALDANGRVVPNVNGELTLTSSDEAATLPKNVQFERGRAVATVSFGTPGEQTLVAKAGELIAEASTTVAPQPVVSDFRIEIRPEVVAGAATTVGVVAVDAEGRVVRDFNGSATLASSDAGATLPETVQFRGGRSYFQVAFAALGEQQITATSGDVTATATTIVKAAPTVSSISVWMPRTTVAGLPMVVQVMALDAEGRPARGFNGSLGVTSSDANARLPGTIEFRNGIALLRVTFMTAGAQTLTVSNASSSLSGTGSTTVWELGIPRIPGRPPLTGG